MNHVGEFLSHKKKLGENIAIGVYGGDHMKRNKRISESGKKSLLLEITEL